MAQRAKLGKLPSDFCQSISPVHCHTIRCSLLGLRPRYSVEADATVGEGAVIFHIVDHADGSIWIGVAEVRLFLIGREHNVVG